MDKWESSILACNWRNQVNGESWLFPVCVFWVHIRDPLVPVIWVKGGGSCQRPSSRPNIGIDQSNPSDLHPILARCWLIFQHQLWHFAAHWAISCFSLPETCITVMLHSGIGSFCVWWREMSANTLAASLLSLGRQLSIGIDLIPLWLVWNHHILMVDALLRLEIASLEAWSYHA